MVLPGLNEVLDDIIVESGVIFRGILSIFIRDRIGMGEPSLYPNRVVRVAYKGIRETDGISIVSLRISNKDDYKEINVKTDIEEQI